MCTSITLIAKDGTVVAGRTNEFECYYNADIIFKPRNTKQQSWSVTQPTEFTWLNKYSYIYSNAIGVVDQKDIACDGMNEHGVGVSVLTFHYHNYIELSIEELNPENINYLNLGAYILGNYSSIEELEKDISRLEKMVYWPKGFTQKGLGIHISITDRSGKTVVIEPESKELRLKLSPTGTLTNSPSLEYHLENLRAYGHLTPEVLSQNIDFRNMEKQDFKIWGNGLVGLPGDFSSNSRFIRAAVLSSIVEKPTSGVQAVQTVFRILNTSDILPGFVNETLTKEEFDEYKEIFPMAIKLNETDSTITEQTDNTLVKDLHNLQYYYKTWNNIKPRVVDFKSLINESEERIIKIHEDGTNWVEKVELK